MNSRLKKILENNEGGGGQFLDCYNQKVHSDIATTIKINIDTSNMYLIYEDDTEYNKGRCLSGDNVTLP